MWTVRSSFSTWDLMTLRVPIVMASVLWARTGAAMKGRAQQSRVAKTARFIGRIVSESRRGVEQSNEGYCLKVAAEGSPRAVPETRCEHVKKCPDVRCALRCVRCMQRVGCRGLAAQDRADRRREERGSGSTRLPERNPRSRTAAQIFAGAAKRSRSRDRGAS